jgi:hypothetical protein
MGLQSPPSKVTIPDREQIEENSNLNPVHAFEELVQSRGRSNDELCSREARKVP